MTMSRRFIEVNNHNKLHLMTINTLVFNFNLNFNLNLKIFLFLTYSY